MTPRIETHYTNRNGASGLWVKTFPFATLSVNFPTDAAGKKAIGAGIVLGTTSIADRREGVPSQFELGQNYPNPFNPATVISYALPAALNVNLSVFNVLGEVVAVLVDGRQSAGYHQAAFEGAGLASGVYFYRLKAGDYVSTKRLLLVR